MKIVAKLVDSEYPNRGFTHTREIVRAIVYDEKGNVAIHNVVRNDKFCPEGPQSYYETPGGGVDAGESYEVALHRECHEELGYDIEIVGELGEVDDDYNLIGRHNKNHYYLAKRTAFVGKHFVSDGDSLIKATLWVPIDEAIRLYQAMPDHYVSQIVKNRELPIFLLAKKAMK